MRLASASLDAVQAPIGDRASLPATGGPTPLHACCPDTEQASHAGLPRWSGRLPAWVGALPH